VSEPPAANALATPRLVTFARPGGEVLHAGVVAGVLPLRGTSVPSEYVPCALKFSVAPLGMDVAGGVPAAVTLIDCKTGGFTVTDAVPVWPCHAAWIVPVDAAVTPAIPERRPLGRIVASVPAVQALVVQATLPVKSAEVPSA